MHEDGLLTSAGGTYLADHSATDRHEPCSKTYVCGVDPRGVSTLLEGGAMTAEAGTLEQRGQLVQGHITLLARLWILIEYTQTFSHFISLATV